MLLLFRAPLWARSWRPQSPLASTSAGRSSTSPSLPWPLRSTPPSRTAGTTTRRPSMQMTRS
eukprot:12055377-Alexandrium_andersonii.AAC.1